MWTWMDLGAVLSRCQEEQKCSEQPCPIDCITTAVESSESSLTLQEKITTAVIEEIRSYIHGRLARQSCYRTISCCVIHSLNDLDLCSFWWWKKRVAESLSNLWSLPDPHAKISWNEVCTVSGGTGPTAVWPAAALLENWGLRLFTTSTRAVNHFRGRREDMLMQLLYSPRALGLTSIFEVQPL